MPIPNLTPRDAGHRDPQFLPDNKHFLYFVAGNPQRPDCIQDGLDGWKRQLVWIDRSGKEVANIDSAHDYGPSYLSMSPDGQQVALQRGVEGNADIWLLDLVRGGTVRFTTAPRPEIAPVWSPDGKRIVFSAFYTSQFDLYRKAIDGTAPELLLSAEDSKQATDWSRDGRYLLYRTINAAADFDIWALPLDGEKKPISVVHTPFEERDAQFFPDGKWIAYQSNESGRFEIYAQPFQRPGARIPISTNGGTQVRWRRDGKEIFYIAKDGRLMAVPLLTDSSGILKPGVAVPLF